VATSFLEAGLVDRLLLFLAPVVVGEGGLAWARGQGPRRMADALRVDGLEVRRVGADLLLEGVPCRPGRGRR